MTLQSPRGISAPWRMTGAPEQRRRRQEDHACAALHCTPTWETGHLRPRRPAGAGAELLCPVTNDRPSVASNHRSRPCSPSCADRGPGQRGSLGAADLGIVDAAGTPTPRRLPTGSEGTRSWFLLQGPPWSSRSGLPTWQQASSGENGPKLHALHGLVPGHTMSSLPSLWVTGGSPDTDGKAPHGARAPQGGPEAAAEARRRLPQKLSHRGHL